MKGGAESLIDKYIRQYGKRLYGLCLSLCVNPFDDDDLYQETWIKVVKNISQYDSSKEFEPWLTKICVNTYRNVLRRLARSPLLDFKTTEEKDALLCAIPDTTENQDYSSLYEAIDRLPEKYRIAVILFYFQDMDIATTAHVMGVPEGTIKSRLSKARKLLKEVLDSEADLQF